MTPSNALTRIGLPVLLALLLGAGCGTAASVSFAELSAAEQALVIDRTEEEVGRAQHVSDALEDRLLLLVASYRAAGRTGRATVLLERVRSRVPARVYTAILALFAAELPEALTVNGRDAALLVADVKRQALADSESIRWHHFGDATRALLEHVRLTTARSYALALVRSAHVEAAREVLRVGMEGATEPRCEKMLGVVGGQRDEVAALLCEQCACDDAD